MRNKIKITLTIDLFRLNLLLMTKKIIKLIAISMIIIKNNKMNNNKNHKNINNNFYNKNSNNF